MPLIVLSWYCLALVCLWRLWWYPCCWLSVVSKQCCCSSNLVLPLMCVNVVSILCCCGITWTCVLPLMYVVRNIMPCSVPYVCFLCVTWLVCQWVLLCFVYSVLLLHRLYAPCDISICCLWCVFVHLSLLRCGIPVLPLILCVASRWLCCSRGLYLAACMYVCGCS